MEKGARGPRLGRFGIFVLSLGRFLTPRLRISAFGLLALLLGALPTGAAAAGIILGSFCVEGVQARTIPSGDVTGDGVQWTAKQYSFDGQPSGGTPASIVVVSKAVAPDAMLPPTCSNFKAAAAAAGAHVVLEGRLVRLAMKVFERQAGETTSFIVDPTGFVATVERVTSGFSTVLGGVLDLRGSRAWIESPTRININPTGMTGTLDIETWNRRVAGAVLETSSGATAKVDLASVDEQNLTLSLDLANGVARLRKARLAATRLNLDLPVSGEVASFGPGHWKAGDLLLTVAADKASVALGNVSGQFSTVSIGDQPLSASASAATAQWTRALSDAVLSSRSVSVGRFAFAGVQISSPDAHILLRGTEAASGRATARFDNLSTGAVHGTITLEAPALPALAFAFPGQAASRVEFSLDGPAASLGVTGKVAARSLDLAGLRFEAPLDLSFARRPADPIVRLPIDVHLRNIGGNFTARDANQTATLIAKLKSLDLTGALLLDLAHPDRSTVDIPAEKLAFELLSTVSAQPILAGTKPTFASAGVTAQSTTEIKVGVAAREGKVGLVTPLFVVGEPILKVGHDGTSSRIALDLKAKGSSTLEYGLDTSKFRIVEAAFAADNIRIHSLDPGFRADVGGVLVDDASLSVSSLRLEVKRDSVVGSASASTVELAGSKVHRDGSDVAFDGALNAPFRIASLIGQFNVTPDQMELTDLTADTVSVGLANARFDFGSGARLDDAGLTLTAAKVRNLSHQGQGAPLADGTYFTALRLRADGKLHVEGDFTLVTAPRISGFDIVLDGRSDQLSGHGSANLDAFAGTFRSALDTGFECESGEKLAIPIAGVVGTGPSALDLHADQGDFYAVGSFAGTTVALTQTQLKSCRSPHKNWHRDAEWASMTGWCPTWSDPKRTCEWKTIVVPEINVGYKIEARFLSLTAIAVLANPRIKLGKHSAFLCNVGPATIQTPLIAAGYYPQLDDNGVVAQLLNTVVEAIAIAVESSLATVLVNAGGTLMSDPIISGSGSAVCIIKGSWS